MVGKTQFILLCFVSTISALQVHAQKNEGIGLFPYVKSNAFYDPGQYALSETSSAQDIGLGISIYKDLSNRVTLFGGYGISVIDGLQYGSEVTSNATYSQLDINIAYNLKERVRLKPSVFFGYGYNYISQLKEFNEKPYGMNINFGAGSELRITNGIGLGYTLTYGFSLADQIRHNFRHQFGLIIRPSNFSNHYSTPKQNNDRVVDNTMDTEEIARLQKEKARLASENDSLRRAWNTRSGNPIEERSLIADYNEELNQKIAYLEEDNQRLLEELRSKRFLTDSILLEDFNMFIVLDPTGAEVDLKKQEMKPGYYLALLGFSSEEVARDSMKTGQFKDITEKYIIKKNTDFAIVGFLSTELEVAMQQYNLIEKKKYLYRVYVF